MSFLGFLTSYYLLIIILVTILVFTVVVVRLNNKLRKTMDVSKSPIIQKDPTYHYHYYFHFDEAKEKETVAGNEKEKMEVVKTEEVKTEPTKVEPVKDDVTAWEKNIVRSLEKRGYKVSKDDIQK